MTDDDVVLDPTTSAVTAAGAGADGRPPSALALSATDAPRLSPRWGAALVAVALMACGGERDHAPEEVENVVLIVIDTLRADHLGCYGYERDTSPTIDALAREGVLFRNAVAQASWTFPSMLSMMTGRYVFELPERVPDDWGTLAEAMQQRGLQTAAFITNPIVGREEGVDRGYDTIHVGEELIPTDWHALPDPKPRSGGIVTKHLLDWASENLTEPYFLYVHYKDPHLVYDPPSGYADFEAQLDPFDERRRSRYRALLAEHPELAETSQDALADISDAIDRYDGEIRYVDECVADLLDGLEALDLMSGTLVALGADHGESIYDHPRFARLVERDEPVEERTLSSYFHLGHGIYLYDELIKTPLIFHGPGVVRGRVVDGYVENTDLFPTLLGAVGGGRPSAGVGFDLGGVLNGLQPRAPERAAVISVSGYGSAVIAANPEVKLIQPNPLGTKAGLVLTLFDLDRDPGEDSNALYLADDASEARAQAVLFLTRALETAQRADFIDQADGELLEATIEKMRALGYLK